MKIRILPVMIYLSVLALIPKVHNIIFNDIEYISSFWVSDSNAKQEEAKENTETKEDDNASKEEKKDAKSSEEILEVNEQKPQEFNCNKNNFTEADVTILQNLSKRRAELDKRENDIYTKEALLMVTEEKLEQKLADLKNTKTELEKLLQEYNKKEDMKIESLVKIYENMKPKEASKIFNDLDMTLLLKVLPKMKEAKVAPILSQMDPHRATEITEKYANQKKFN